MACIGKIASGLAMPCGVPGTPDLGRIVGARVINASDIASFTVSPSTAAASITRVTGTVGYELTTVNNSMVITVGLKSQDIMPGAYDVAITFKTFSGHGDLASIGTSLGGVSRLANAELVFAVKHDGGRYKIYGLGAPLVCTELSGDSSASGQVTYTYGVEDWQVGTTVHYIDEETYNALVTPAVAPVAPVAPGA